MDYEYDTHMDDDEPKKKIRRRYYTSNTPETYIKDAISGGRYPWKVGSYDSLRLYRFIDATGTCDNEGRPYTKGDKNISRDANICYYSSPEECMNHRKFIMENNVINEWYTFQEKVFPNGEFNKISYIAYKSSLK